MSFHRTGESKAAKDIEQHELSLVSSSVSKPYSFKIPTHVIEGIDVLSSHMGISRNQFVNQLITSFLAQSFSEFVDGYSSAFIAQGQNEGQILIDELNKALTGADISDDAVLFLNQEILRFIEEHDMASKVYIDLLSGRLEANDD